MNKLLFSLLIFGLILFSCTEHEGNQVETAIQTIDELDETSESDTSFNQDLEEITQLVRDVYVWHDQGNPMLIEMILDSVDSIYTGYDWFEHDLASEEIGESSFFTQGFSKNYATIHEAVDIKLKSGEIEWKYGALPNYGSGAEPWCNCQDVPYDEPNPWSEIEVETINLTKDSGEFYWKWAKVDRDSDWGKFKYYFKVKKVDNEWKIDYLEGLNVEDFTRRNF